MSFITDERLFYAGIIMSGCALVLLILCVCVLQVKKTRLKAQLDAEYGERTGK